MQTDCAKPESTGCVTEKEKREEYKIFSGKV